MKILLHYSLVSLLFGWSEGLSSSYEKTTRNIATQTLQGAGPASVDMNQYNLPLNKIEEEWTANFVQKTAEKEQGVFLGAKNESENFVDTVMVTFPRSMDTGLGIELTELAGGRDDGLGITVVTGLVPGGSADGAGILPGDSITEVSVVRMKRQTGGDSLLVLEEKQQQWNVRTECFSYDATVDAILSLPFFVEGYEDIFTLKMKRLRRKPMVTVKLQYPPEQNEPDTTIEMFAGENLRQGMLVRGVKLNDPLAQRFDTKSEGNCGAGGLCRTCSVSVLNGGELLNPQRVAEEQMLRDNPRWRLACKAIVGFGMKEGEMTVRVNPKQW
jgi:ferredoxin